MKIRCTVPLTATMMCILLAMPASAGAGSDHKTLQVKLNYSGAGIVDEKHKMYVLLFDANPFTATSLINSSSDPATPAVAAGVSHILRRLSASEKNATVTFTNLGSPTVYAAAFADQSGAYDGHSDPAGGTPMGIYRKAPDKIEPIKLEDSKNVEIVLAFDDSLKTP